MSNRTLIEINHDFAGAFDRVPDLFVGIVAHLLRSGDSPEVRQRLEQFGIRVFGTRHHSDAFAIDWGGVKSAEPSTPKS